MPKRPHMPLIAATAFVAVLATLSLSACKATAPPASSDSGSKPTTSAPGVDGGAAQPSSLSQIKLGVKLVVKGLDQPLFVTNAGDGTGRLFVVEQTGRVRVIRDGKLLPDPFLDLTGSISTGGERGLLGLAFAPDFKTSGDVYVNYTDVNGDTVIERYTAEDPASDTPFFNEPDPVFTHKQPYSNHNGGCVMFAPDGTLWVGTGDGGSAGDPGNRAQNPKVMLGKMLSFDVANGAHPKPVVVMTGLRNPWRFSFDSANNDVWIADVGQDAWEEVDYTTFAEAQGRNWGWNLWEGNHTYPERSTQSRDGYSFPLVEYSHAKGESITGGYVYRGAAYPALQGVYVYGDFVNGWLAMARRGTDGSADSRDLLLKGKIVPSSFGVSEDDELFVCDYNGALFQVTAR